MSEFFSERNGLIENTDNDYSLSFRRAIVTSFFNQYNVLDAAELYGKLQSVMDLFGIEQSLQMADRKALVSNKILTEEYFKECPWNHLFDFVEYVLTLDPDRAGTLAEKYNKIFRLHGCKYRLVNGRVVPIVNELEIREITKAMNTGVEATDTAYKEAISLLSKRHNPDYNAVIAKTSNALESMVLAIATENAVTEITLGRAIGKLESKGVVIEDRMKGLIKSIYHYACNAGIRHGGATTVVTTEADAILVLVISAAAINYLNALRLG